MEVSVYNEVGWLRKVLVHTPGEEIVRMTQRELDRLLFDDILSPAEAIREHEILVQVLAGTGAEVIQFADLMRRAIERAPANELRALLEGVAEIAGVSELAQHLSSWSPARLTEGLISGVYWNDLESRSLARIRASILGTDTMALWPVPNLMFMRDPCMAVFDGVVVGRMATQARARESMMVAFALSWGEDDGAPPTKLVFADRDAARHRPFRKLEGGDVMVLSPTTLLIGCSERTSPQTLERLAHEALFPAHPALARIYAVMMPEGRSVMHLDTILTQLDGKIFLGHRPLIQGQGDHPPAPIARLTRDRPPELVARATALDVLRDEIGSEVELVPCGGDDPLYQEREQWTDGANAVCLAPGRILLYSRNVRTIEALGRQGFEEVRLSVVQPKEQRAELIAAGMKKDRVVFSFSGSELSRARGGGRCLTMPLARD
jgi:arginine deiminase